MPSEKMLIRLGVVIIVLCLGLALGAVIHSFSPPPVADCAPIEARLSAQEDALGEQYVQLMPDQGVTGKQITLVAKELKAVQSRLQAVKSGIANCRYGPG
jgi:uncharacterized membrane-anchored protein YhcB (DUF1043 family)